MPWFLPKKLSVSNLPQQIEKWIAALEAMHLIEVNEQGDIVRIDAPLANRNPFLHGTRRTLRELADHDFSDLFRLLNQYLVQLSQDYPDLFHGHYFPEKFSNQYPNASQLRALGKIPIHERRQKFTTQHLLTEIIHASLDILVSGLNITLEEYYIRDRQHIQSLVHKLRTINQNHNSKKRMLNKLEDACKQNKVAFLQRVQTLVSGRAQEFIVSVSRYLGDRSDDLAQRIKALPDADQALGECARACTWDDLKLNEAKLAAIEALLLRRRIDLDAQPLRELYDYILLCTEFGGQSFGPDRPKAEDEAVEKYSKDPAKQVALRQYVKKLDECCGHLHCCRALTYQALMAYLNYKHPVAAETAETRRIKEQMISKVYAGASIAVTALKLLPQTLVELDKISQKLFPDVVTAYRFLPPILSTKSVQRLTSAQQLPSAATIDIADTALRINGKTYFFRKKHKTYADRMRQIEYIMQRDYQIPRVDCEELLNQLGKNQPDGLLLAPLNFVCRSGFSVQNAEIKNIDIKYERSTRAFGVRIRGQIKEFVSQRNLNISPTMGDGVKPLVSVDISYTMPALDPKSTQRETKLNHLDVYIHDQLLNERFAIIPGVWARLTNYFKTHPLITTIAYFASFLGVGGVVGGGLAMLTFVCSIVIFPEFTVPLMIAAGVVAGVVGSGFFGTIFTAWRANQSMIPTMPALQEFSAIEQEHSSQSMLSLFGEDFDEEPRGTEREQNGYRRNFDLFEQFEFPPTRSAPPSDEFYFEHVTRLSS